MNTEEQAPDADIRAIAMMLGVHARWLPEGEHAMRILEAVQYGVAFLEHRGHRLPPLLIFNDGGSMELPNVRWMKTTTGERLTSVSGSHADDQTTHYDVCGTSDAILDVVAAKGDLELLVPLLDDIESMILRMKSRRDEYETFLQAIRDSIEQSVRRKDVEPAFPRIEKLKARFKSASDAGTNAEEIVETVEAVRDVAQFLEYSLSDYRKIAIEIGTLLQELQGGRDWSKVRKPDHSI